MNQLIQQTPFWLLVTISIAFIGLLGYVFGIKREKSLPDESDVIGKDLPVGSFFLKDGKVVEVVGGSLYCGDCVFDSLPVHESECYNQKHPLCAPGRRSKRDAVTFQYVNHE